MQIRPGMNISLTSLTRRYENADGTVEQRTYRAGDPEFDAYVAEQKQKREAARNSLPRNFLLDAVGKDGTSAVFLGQKLHQSFVQYYDGALDQKGLESAIGDVVSNLRSAYVEKGFDEKEFMPKLLQDVYVRAMTDNIGAVDERSLKDARELAAYYNGDDRNSKDFIYYDAKYYYQSEEMKDTIIDIMNKIAQQYDVSDVDFPKDYAAHNKLLKSIYGSYNTVSNNTLRQEFMIGNMLDESMVPPKGFRFFYKGNESGRNNYKGIPSSDGTLESAFDGILHVQYGDWSYVGRIPVRQDATRFPVSVNMYDYVSKKRTDIPKEIVPMMKNWDFFTVIQSGRYCDSHPRKLP